MNAQNAVTRGPRLLGLLALVALATAASGARAQLVADAGWIFDQWGGSLPVFTSNSLNPDSSGYDLTILETSLLTIADDFVEGDVFSLYDDGFLLASSTQTPGVMYWPASSGGSDEALTSGDYHTLQYVLAPGEYQIGIEVTSGLDSGALGVRLDTGIPEPTTLAMASSVLAFAATRRRR